MARRSPVNLGADLGGVPVMCMPQHAHSQWSRALE